MQMKSSQGSLNIEKLINDAVSVFKKEFGFRVEPGVSRILTETGLKERVYLEKEYAQQKFTVNDLSNAINKLLYRGMLMAWEEGISAINADIVERVMKVNCPFFPWC